MPYDEPLLEYRPSVPDEIATRIGRYVARIVEDGDTIQVGYGSVPNAIMSALGRKKHLGVHTELLTDGLVDLIRRGVIDNSRKTIDQRQDRHLVLHGQPATPTTSSTATRRSSSRRSTTPTTRW